jgi:hypothetical protein
VNPEQTVSEMVGEILDRQASALTDRTGEPFERAMAAALKTHAARQLKELADGDHSGWKAAEWQAMLLRARAEERHYSRLESYMESLEGKESRARYYALLEALSGPRGWIARPAPGG